MAGAPERWSDERIEQVLSALLRIGVIAAAAIVLAGGVFYLIRYGGTTPDYRVFHGEPADLRGVGGIVREVLGLHRRATIQLGLLVLMAIPVARVALQSFAFLKQRDTTYVIISLAVLSLLIFSMAGGGR